jgi:hypothetical protein
MILVKATADTEAGGFPEDSKKIFAAMETYHQELAKAGVLLDANGLKPTSRGARIRYAGGKGTWTDGPFTETKELVAGYTLIQTKTREEAFEWARRFPSPHGKAEGEIEIRELFELEDLADFADAEAIDRFRQLQKAR